MKQLIIIAIAAIAALAGCKKDPECEKLIAGTLHFHNQHTAAVDVYIAGNFRQTVQAGEIVDIFPVTTGTHTISVSEQNNSCSDFTTQFDIFQCETTNFAYASDALCCQVNNTGQFHLINSTAKLVIWRLVDVSSFADLYAGDQADFDLPVGNYHFVAYSPQGGSWEMYFEIEQCQTDGINIVD